MVDRKLAGAHYGLKDWATQRITAVVMLVYTVALIAFLLLLPNEHGEWQAFWNNAWVKLFTQITFIALFIHAWVGIRDLWMDYVKPFGIRLCLQAATVVWLVACMVYSVKVIWG
ncbi:succinate dehydrogenase, hydrophobic membrane anchor protein [Neisseria perflava]|uniref:succinate dehydrogenase, hydrophobic membrane anchor protein n=1 Tax=Neisseria perflava TaxID=33053 RepID=UPI00209CAA43|nr:succinate dehydrogenase, hydrophobic membrane anchor protein [Neisseria perflava]MCP1661261.1 succinate dehydrogenase / fumarate reductase membrane anchor subunit [Neisseria perflava]MCP1771675.1 succinate dehydrogenase / fumarate reductase membrane anchor subunit [Neisseria perflava]